MHTFHAPAERLSRQELQASIDLLAKTTISQSLLNSQAGIGMILNKYRQIIAVNNSLVELFQLDCEYMSYGLRPGELINCVHATKNEGGCGTDKACRNCGAVRAILASYESSSPVVDICYLRYHSDKDTLRDAKFEVVASPVILGDEHFTIVFLRDITEEENKQNLEKFFYHDIKNVLGALIGYVELVKYRPENQERYIEEIEKITLRLNDEIEMHRTLKYAKDNLYKLSLNSHNMRDIVEECERYIQGAFPQQRYRLAVDLSSESADLRIVSDKTLLLRILTNMLKNAFEAPNKEGAITLHISKSEGAHLFSVENVGEIPEDIQLRIFQEYFTTKEGSGHGNGTSSMKLFGEKLLQGKVSFQCENNRTTFIFEHPMLSEKS